MEDRDRDPYGGIGLGADRIRLPKKRTGPASASQPQPQPPNLKVLGMPLQSERRGRDNAEPDPPQTDASGAAVMRMTRPGERDMMGGGGEARDGTADVTIGPGGERLYASSGPFYIEPAASDPEIPQGAVVQAIDGRAFEELFRRTQIDYVKRFVDFVAGRMHISSAKLYDVANEFVTWRHETDVAAGRFVNSEGVEVPNIPPLQGETPSEYRNRNYRHGQSEAHRLRADAGYPGPTERHNADPWLVLRADCGRLAGDMAYAWERWIARLVGDFTGGTSQTLPPAMQLQNRVLKHDRAHMAWGMLTVAQMTQDTATRGARVSSVRTQNAVRDIDNRAIQDAWRILRECGFAVAGSGSGVRFGGGRGVGVVSCASNLY